MPMNIPVSMTTGADRVPIWKHWGRNRRQPRAEVISSGMKEAA
jgi:hypothetical protein